jgi:ribosomal protein L40E
MRYCPVCRRFNIGHPNFCQYCGRSWDGRVCLSCGELNSPDALYCGWCGKETLSEILPTVPLWARLLPLMIPVAFWAFVIWFGKPLIVAGFGCFPFIAVSLLCLAKTCPPSCEVGS